MIKTFRKDVLEGLSKKQKTLHSRYFYDEKGDALFQQIMQMDEYYLPACELDIIQNRSFDIAGQLKSDSNTWHIIELGAGDGVKTVELLKRLQQQGLELSYTALDISSNILDENKQRMENELPDMRVDSVAGNFFNTCHATLRPRVNNLILFLGSNIGNFTEDRANAFFRWLRPCMSSMDKLLIAFDLKKHPKTILNAYNDSAGVTAAFNLNLLERINRELGADFQLDKFEHYPSYNPLTGYCYSFLVSLKKQTVTIGDTRVNFNKNEMIQTEVSRKYNLDEIEKLSCENGFDSKIHFLDSKLFYSISLFELL